VTAGHSRFDAPLPAEGTGEGRLWAEVARAAAPWSCAAARSEIQRCPANFRRDL